HAAKPISDSAAAHREGEPARAAERSCSQLSISSSRQATEFGPSRTRPGNFSAFSSRRRCPRLNLMPLIRRSAESSSRVTFIPAPPQEEALAYPSPRPCTVSETEFFLTLRPRDALRYRATTLIVSLSLRLNPARDAVSSSTPRSSSAIP